jgi:hypothetical protein
MASIIENTETETTTVHVSDQYVQQMHCNGFGVVNCDEKLAFDAGYEYCTPLCNIVHIAKKKLFDRLIGLFIFDDGKLTCVWLVAENTTFLRWLFGYKPQWNFIRGRDSSGHFIFDKTHMLEKCISHEQINNALTGKDIEIRRDNTIYHVVEIPLPKYAKVKSYFD